VDAAHASSRKEHVLRLFGLEKCARGVGVCEVKLSVGAQQKVIETVGLEYAHQCGAHQAAVARDVDPVGDA